MGVGNGGTGKNKWGQPKKNMSLAAFLDAADTNDTLDLDINGLPKAVTDEHWDTLSNLYTNGKLHLCHCCHPNRVLTPVPYPQTPYPR
eukprot:239487-Rhodomonas_salina.1